MCVHTAVTPVFEFKLAGVSLSLRKNMSTLGRASHLLFHRRKLAPRRCYSGRTVGPPGDYDLLVVLFFCVGWYED